MIQRFGEPAFEGLAVLAERMAKVGGEYGWLPALADLARKGRLQATWSDRLRWIAARWLCSPRYRGEPEPLYVLSCVGAPPVLVDRLWVAAVLLPCPVRGSGRRAFPMAVHWARITLAAVIEASALEERIEEDGARALGEGDFEMLERLVALGCLRSSDASASLAMRVFEDVDHHPAAVGEATRCAYAMAEAKRLPADWLLVALQEPGLLRFTIASRVCRREATPEMKAALTAALSSTARGGAAAVEAAHALLAIKALGVDDERLPGILERAPAALRGELAGLMLRQGAPLARVRRHLLSALRSGDAWGASVALDDLISEKPIGMDALLEEARAPGLASEILESIERILGEPTEVDRYWQHEVEGEDEDEVEAFLAAEEPGDD